MKEGNIRKIGLAVLLSIFCWVAVVAQNEPKFVENKGQHPEQVEYSLRIANAELFFENDQLTFNFYNPELLHEHGQEHEHSSADHETLGHAYNMRFLGAKPDAQTVGRGAKYPDQINYIQNGKTISNVESYRRLVYEEIYDGIDFEYFGHDGHLKYDVLVRVGADPTDIKLKYEGADRVELKGGKLYVSNTFNEVQESIPLAYQEINGKQVPVDCEYELNDDVVSFMFPNGYDSDYDLVIDPTLIFSSYSGSTANNFGFTATYDAQGALYGGGIAFSLGYPTVTGSYSETFGGVIDMAISKFSPDGTTLIYSTYIGGISADVPHSMVVNSQGELVILGTTSSPNYPTSSGAYDSSFNGGTAVNYTSNGTNFENGSDIVVTVLSADGSSLVGSTFLGGSENDGVNDDGNLTYNYGDIFRGEVIVDDQDQIYIASSTESGDFPITSGVIGQALGGNQDACIAKFNSNVSALIWSTYLGGDGADAGYSIKLNSSNELYVTGGTEGQGFPVVSGGLNTTYGGGQTDGYLIRLNNTATTVLSGTYLGTSLYDQSYFVEVDHEDDVYAYGQTEGSYPVTGGVFSNPGSKQFIHRLSADLSTTLMSTVFGSGSAEVNISPTAFLVDICKRIYISGWGGGTNNSWNSSTGNTNAMPTTPDGYQLTTDGSDFYFMVLEADAASLLYASYFGADGINEHVDGGTSRFNSGGVIHQAVCAGCQNSDDFPTTPGVVSNDNNSTGCNLGVIKLDLEMPLVDVEVSFDTTQTGCVPYEVTFNADILVAPDFVWYFDDGDSSLLANPTHTYTIPGTYEVLLVGTNTNCQGNQFTDTAFVTIVATISTDSVSAGPDQQLCPGETAQLNATGELGAVFSWTPTDFLTDPNIPNPIADPPVSTEYVVQTIGSDGCTAFDTVLIQVDELELEVSADTAICIGDTIQLNAAGSGTYLWSPNVNISDVGISNPLVFPVISTTYHVFLETPAGCTSTDSVLVLVQAIPVANAGSDQEICLGDTVQLFGSGGLNYEWSPVTSLSDPFIQNPLANPSSSIIYTVTVSDNIGCSSSDSMEVSVNPLPVAVAGPDESICPGSTVQLNASGGTSYSWSPILGLSNPNISNPVAGPIAPTEYVVTVTDANSCSDSDTIFVDVFTVEAIGEAEICLGDSTQISAVGGISWNWAPPIGLSDASIQSPFASPIITTTYTVFADDGNGCFAIDSVLVTVNPLPQANAGPDAEICIGQSVVLQGSGGVSYAWDPPTFLDDPNIQLPVSSTETTITYTVTVTDVNSCSDADEMIVTVNPLPAVEAGPDSMICANSSLVLQASGAQDYLWSPLVGISDPQSANPTASPLIETVYHVVGTDANGCVNSDSVTISIFTAVANAGDGVICLNDSIQANIIGGVSYSWNPTIGVSDPSIANPYLSPESSTQYEISVTSAFGCEAITEVFIQVLDIPIAAFEASFAPGCEGIYALFTNNSENSDVYSWYFGDGNSSSDSEPSYIFPPGPGAHVTLIAYNNDSLCVDSITIDYSGQWFGNDSIEIEYANIFTPNFDGINDCFKPEVSGVYSDCYELVVYNRWGELLFESISGQQHCWDGRTKGGIMVPEGTYYYISNVRGMDHAGYVTVIYQ